MKIKNRETNYYGKTDTWLYEALGKYQQYITDKNVGVIGSVLPWYESIVLSYGGKPTTIEYNTIISEDPRLEILTVEAFEKDPRRFDVLLSISSIEHDGLGRYGDPLNPNGDFEAMQKSCEMLKEDGLLFLAVPVGSDCLVWNAHRIYGKIRLPLLLKGWEVVDTFGFDQSAFDKKISKDGSYQPIFVLRSKKS